MPTARSPRGPRRINDARILRPLEMLKNMLLTRSLVIVEGWVLGRVDGWHSWRKSETLSKRDRHDPRR